MGHSRIGMIRWKTIAASVRGTSHVRTSTRLQDAFVSFEQVCSTEVLNQTYLVSIVSDGAGSAEKGGEGASLVCRTLSVLSREHISRGGGLPDLATIHQWLMTVRERLEVAAKNREINSRQFAATLVFVVASSDAVSAIHIGDGAVVGKRRGADSWETISSPDSGEYASTTYFVTDQPQPRVRAHVEIGSFEALALFSDGIERLVLDFRDFAPSDHFFDAMLRPLVSGISEGRDRELSRQLSKFLNSSRVNERTDDDKTLVLSTRL